MKKNIIYPAFVLIFVSFFSLNIAIAQKSFQDGFVITTQKDTLVGKLSNIHKNSHNYIDFLFPNGRDTVFTPNHILSYEMGNTRYVIVPVPHPVKLDTAYYFAKVLVDGYASLYQTKIKTDFLTPAEEAFLCKKYNQNQYFPAGQLKNLVTFFSDYTYLENELKNHIHLYNNELETKIQLFNHYNSWKRHHMDSVAAHKLLARIEKIQLEVFVSSDSNNLVPESRYELDKISSKLSLDPNLIMVMEFVTIKGNEKLEKKAMKAILKHLNTFDARLDETMINIPDNQGIRPSKSNGQILYYYFR
ncbi:MAG: hypothetical protein H7329_14335 [Opitutaceae bacterium]|nr:hypothetical protein [Cytophagales bacterium]